MVVPLLPLLAAGGLGAGVGGLIGNILGGKKGSASSTQTTTYHPYAFYQPTRSTQIQYPSYQFIIDSPLASQDMTKKQSSIQQPSIAAPITSTPTGVMEPATAGSELMPFVLVGGAALIGYALISKPSPKRRR